MICERVACDKNPAWVLKFKDGEKEYYCNKHKPLTIKSFGTENLRGQKPKEAKKNEH